MNSPAYLNKLIEYSYLAIAWVSAATCLIRTDFNFPIALFTYYYWITKPFNEKTRPLIIIGVLLIVFDIIWVTTAGSSWTSVYSGADLWNSMKRIRIFAYLLSFVNILIKAGIVGMIIIL